MQDLEKNKREICEKEFLLEDFINRDNNPVVYYLFPSIYPCVFLNARMVEELYA